MHSSRMRTARSVTMGGLHAGGVLHAGGFSIEGGFSMQGGGFSIQGGFSMQGGSPSRGGFSIQGGVLHPGGVSPSRGVPCDLSHHAFDVTCMLSPHQLRPTNSAAAYIVVVQGMMGYPPTPLLTESQTPVKT